MKVRNPSPPARPPAPPELPDLLTDQGPMRSELLRQIAQLEGELAVLTARHEPWRRRRASPTRGPRLLDTADLEAIRDELLAALDAVMEDARGQAQPEA